MSNSKQRSLIQALRSSIDAEKLEGSEFERFASSNLYIRTEDKKVVPYALREVQRELHRDLSRRDIVLKARKHGISTDTLARYYRLVTTTPNTLAATVAHTPDGTQALWEIIQLFYEHDPRRLHTRYASRRELYFDELNSRFVVLQAGKGAGRARTINYLHISELAWWDKEAMTTIAGMMAAVPEEPGTEILIESTANGEGNEYHRRWQSAVNGASEFQAHFFPWWSHPSYRRPWRGGRIEPAERLVMKLAEQAGEQLTKDQLQFRRDRIADVGSDLFEQEYPATPEEAFLSSGRPVFDRKALGRLQALHGTAPIQESRDGLSYVRIYKLPKRGRRYIAGCDTSEGVIRGDAQSLGIMDHETLEEVAVLHGRWPIHVFARKAAALVNRYRAFVACERNNHGHAVLEHWLNGKDEHRVPRERIYFHKNYDAGRVRRVPGFDTNTKSRPVMVADLEEAIRKEHLEIHEREFYGEARAFAYDDAGKPQAPEGMHDDRVMRVALELQARKHLTGETGFQSTSIPVGI